MNVKALRAFCLVMRHGSLAGAACDLHLSQPAVSRLVSNLEYSLGLRLFHRDKRTLRPTRQAHAFFREASRILSGLEQLPEIARAIESGDGMQLRVVAMSRLAHMLIVPAVRRYRERFPSVRLTLEMHHRRDIERWLAGRQFDLGFGPLPVDDPSLEVEPLCAGDAMAVFSSGQAWAGRSSLSVKDLANAPLIALTPDTLMQSQIEAIFANAGLKPRVVMRTSTSSLACALAQAGQGFTIVDPFMARRFSPEAASAVIRPRFRMEFGTLWPAGLPRPETALAFQDCVKGVVRAFGSPVKIIK